MYKGAIYSCYCVCWDWTKEPQWEFEVITLTNKTCKLKQIKKPNYDYISLDWKDKILRSKDGKMKEFLKEEFIKYRIDVWMPFIFKIK